MLLRGPTKKLAVVIAHEGNLYYLHFASKLYIFIFVAKQNKSKWRSGCPLNASVEMLGDRWSLLIIRDIMLFGPRSFKQLLAGHEKIATNILTDRVRRLKGHRIIQAHPHPTDGRKLYYSLTKKGIDLAPVLTEMVLWAAGYEKTDNQALLREMRKDKEGFIAMIREQWAEQNPDGS
jgi:DNA-binding HxlR family transcriptional regulator